METKAIGSKRAAFRGQSFVEFSIVILVLCVLVFGVIEFARMISMTSRIATVAREVARTINSTDYDTTQVASAFNIATNMMTPGNLTTEGRVIVTFIEKVAGTATNILSTSHPNYAGNTNDYLIMKERHFYPYSGSTTNPVTNDWRVSLESRLGNDMHNGLSGTSRRYTPYLNTVGSVSTGMLAVGGKTVVVEVFYTNNLSIYLGGLGIKTPAFLYDTVAF
jgi:Flp pilus assembly protein TadG